MNIMDSQGALGSNPVMDELSDFRFTTSLSLRFLFIKRQIIIEVTRITTKIISNSKFLWSINLKTHIRS